jgi:isopentenyl diphosphate isomerase/L-lactate dehydrogenase-like FMN-dependent dehydrogenase
MVKAAPGIGDLAQAARRRIPRFAFDFLDGGAGNEAGVRRNRERLDAILLKPRCAVGVDPDTSVCLFGRNYALPFGVAPVGMGNLMWPGGDLALARLAATHGIPLVVSTAATTSLEEMAAAAGSNAWFQLYVARDPAINRDLLERAWRAGIRVLVVTTDVPIPGDRRRDRRNRFVLPFRPTLSFIAQVIAHPEWALATLRAGPPGFPNYAPYRPRGVSRPMAEFMSEQIKGDFRWSDLAPLRQQWPGSLVVKGLLAPEDAALALEHGADAVWVSNHGGRQLDSAPAAVDALARVRVALGPHAVVLMDGGIRSGEDVAKAHILGANMVFSGRSFYYGTAAGGAAGAARAMTLLAEDLRRVMVQLGASGIAELDRRWLWE